MNRIGARLVLACLSSLSLAACGSESTPESNVAPGAGDASAPLSDAEAEGSGVDGGRADSGDAATLAPACLDFAAPTEVGRVPSPIVEASGIVASQANPGVLYTHNDSGDSARIFALKPTGALLSELVIGGATATDWEDIAIGPCSAGSAAHCIYIADIGDNLEKRTGLTIYKVPEPSLDAADAGTPASQTLANAAKISAKYSDKAHNAETLIVDPLTADVFIVTKDAAGPSSLFRASAAEIATGSVVFQRVGQLNFGAPPYSGSQLAVGGDITADGLRLVVRTYDRAYVWTREKNTTLGEAMAKTPCLAPLATEVQGEAIAFRADGKGYFTLSEGANVPLYFVASK